MDQVSTSPSITSVENTTSTETPTTPLENTTSTVELPDKLYMTGFPFFMQGWNAKYKRVGNTYRLEPYTLYGTIPIIGVTLYKAHGKWRLQRDCDYFYMEINKLDDNQDTPIGKWTYGGTVCQKLPFYKRPFY